MYLVRSKRLTRGVGYVDAIVTTNSIILLILVATLPLWLPEDALDSNEYSEVAPHLFRDAGSKFSFKMFKHEVIRSLLHRGYVESPWIASSIVAIFLFICLLASAVLVISTKTPKQNREEALKMARFWMFSNSIFLIICLFGFLGVPFLIFLWLFIPVRVLLMMFVWRYIDEMQSRYAWSGQKVFDKFNRQEIPIEYISGIARLPGRFAVSALQIRRFSDVSSASIPAI